jgi:hypothetical protein
MRHFALYLICMALVAGLVACGGTSQTVQPDPIFKDYYDVRDESGQEIGIAVKISKHEWRLYRDDSGKSVIIRDPIFKDDFIIFEKKGGYSDSSNSQRKG